MPRGRHLTTEEDDPFPRQADFRQTESIKNRTT